MSERGATMTTETKKTFEQMTEIERQKVGEALWTRERPRCQSSLVDDLLKRGDIDGFTIDDMQNVYADPSDWGLEQCRDYIREYGGDEGSVNPWKMDRAELVETLTGIDIQCRDDESDDTLRAAVIANIDDETLDGLKEWRDAAQESASENPAEVFEWWEVGDWLCKRLGQEGEVYISNDYGDWWGRCTTGQSVYLDHTIQKLGAEYCAWALDKS